MGRRKIEIKAIKDDRNRSVTFLKRKGGLFKKAHELSVLCSVDVAVFVFGNNKKLYEYSSADMRDLITRYQYHGGPNEHKGPNDFSGGNDDDDDDEAEPSPPLLPDSLEAQMMPPQYHGQQPPQFHQMRHQTASASPPIPNGAFPGHPHHTQRGTTPQPTGNSRPGSRNDVRRMTPGMVPQGGHQGVPYMPTPPIYNPSHGPPPMVAQHGPQYPYPPPPQQQQQQQQQPQPHPPPHSQSLPQPQPQPQQQPHAYMDERRVSAPPSYTSQPSHSMPTISRSEPSPPLPAHSHIQSIPQISTTPPQPERREPQPPPPVPRMEQPERPQPPLLNTDTAIKKLPQRKSHSIFTPIEENRSILSQHLASFANDAQAAKTEASLAGAAANAGRPHSVDVMSSGRRPSPPRSNANEQNKSRTVSISSATETFTPPSRTNSLKTAAASTPGGARPRGPRLTVQIPDGGSEPGSATGADSVSPRPAETTSHITQRQNSVVLPPPSPSASALLSAGASGPPNPFARPPPQPNNAETPASALPSRFLSTEFLPSPSSFYNNWNFQAVGDNTLPSPLNFATPVTGAGPSFLREESSFNNNTSSGAASTNGVANNAQTGAKRKSPDPGHAEGPEMATDAKRVKVE